METCGYLGSSLTEARHWTGCREQLLGSKTIGYLSQRSASSWPGVRAADTTHCETGVAVGGLPTLTELASGAMLMKDSGDNGGGYGESPVSVALEDARVTTVPEIRPPNRRNCMFRSPCQRLGGNAFLLPGEQG